MKRVINFEFILIDAFSMMSVVTAIEPLRVANRILDETRYAWHLRHEEGDSPQASNGLGFPTGPLDPTADGMDFTFVCAGMHTDLRQPSKLYALLNARRRAGGTIGAVSLAPIILARAGLLRGHKTAMHWEGLSAFKEEFPDIEVTTDLFQIDGALITSCGGLATLDLFLEILRRDQESWLVQAVANQLQVSQARSSHEQQHIGVFRLPVTAPRSMHKAVALIDQNIETPLSPETLAAAVGASRRTLDRRFKDHTGLSVGEFYANRRLEQAKALLLQSNLSVMDIGLATGFAAASHFAASFRSAYGQSPREFRAGHSERTRPEA